MTAAITVHDDEPEFAVDRDPQGEVTLTIHADGSTIRVNVGRLYASVSLLAQSLHRLAEDVDADILEAWYEVPEESDAYISFDHGRYHVSLEGVPVGDYPSQDVAELELARAMVCGGVFPPAWFINDHGNCDDINENIRRWHDDAGDAMVPLAGVQYQPGDRVAYTGIDWPCVVINEWGPAGVEIHTAGDPSIRTHVTCRGELYAITD